MKELALLIIFLNISITHTFAQSQSEEALLQEGHKYNYANKIDQAIDLYKQSLKVNPNYYPAQSSLKGAYIRKKISDYKKSLPLKCQESNDYDTIKSCLMEYFTIKGEPINPNIFISFLISVADPADIQDQIVSINLLDSQDSNSFYLDTTYEYNIEKYNDFYKLSYGIPQGNDVSRYIFKIEGRSDNNTYVVSANWNDGRLPSTRVLFLRIREDLGVEGESVNDNIYPKNLLLTRKRLLIEKIGEVKLYGDSHSSIKIQNNTTIITNGKRIIHIVT